MQLRDEHERVPNAFQMRLYSSVTPHLQSMRTTSVCTVQLRDKHHERVPNAFVLKCHPSFAIHAYNLRIYSAAQRRTS